MTRFFFDFIGDVEQVTDQDGLDLTDASCAKAEAAKALAEVASQSIVNQTPCRMQVQIRNSKGHVLSTIGFSLFTIE